MTNRDGCEAPRGAELQTFDLLAAVLPSEHGFASSTRACRGHGEQRPSTKLLGVKSRVWEFTACSHRGGHGEVVNDLQEDGASVAAKDTPRHGYSPLHVAIPKQGNADGATTKYCCAKGLTKTP